MRALPYQQYLVLHAPSALVCPAVVTHLPSAPPPLPPLAGLHLHRLLVPRDRTKGAPVDLVAALLDKGARVDEREPESGAPLLHKVRAEASSLCKDECKVGLLDLWSHELRRLASPRCC